MPPPTTAQHPHTTFDPETKYRLLLRVHSAEELPHKSSQGAYCKLYVGDTAMLDGSQKKLIKGDSNGGDDNNNAVGDDDIDAHRVFRTQTKAAVLSPTTQKNETTWDEIFEVSVRDPNTEVLSLRVKSQHRFYCPVIGTFAVYLHHLRVGHQADQWFPLRRGKKEAGKIRLHLLLTPEHVAHGGAGGAGGRGKKKRNSSDMAPDIKVALAANFEADQAIQRLVAKQLKDEEDRKARRLRGEKSDDEDDEANNNQRAFHGSTRGGANDAVTKQMNVLSIAKVKEPALGSGRGEARFPVLLPLSPSGQDNNRGDAPVVRVSSANSNGRRSENFARLNQLDPVAVVVKEGRHQGDALGSGRSSNSARYAVPGLVAVSMNSHLSRSSPTSPVGSGAPQRSALFGADAGTQASTGERMSEADRNRRRNEKFAHLKELDADPVAHLGSGRVSGATSRSSLPNTPSSNSNHRQSLNSPVGSANGSARQHHPGLYSIPSFGPADFNQRHSGSSTDSDSLASAAEYERRIDRKLRKVRKQTEKLRKIKAQLRKYIPDLTDSDSDDASSSSSSSGSTGEKRKNKSGQQQQQQQQQQQSTGGVRSSSSTSSGRNAVQRHYF